MSNVSTLITSPIRSLIGLALVALGLPVYYFQSRTNSTPVTDAGSDEANY